LQARPTAWTWADAGLGPGLTPGHWHLGTDQVSLLDPAQLALDEAGFAGLVRCREPLFTSEGFLMRLGRPAALVLAHPAWPAWPPRRWTA
jgi:hypothetical protein